VILMEGSESALPALAAQLRKDCGKNVELLAAADAALACKAGRIYLGDLGKLWDGLLSTYRKNRASLLVYGVLSKASTRKLAAWPKASAQILIEDLKEAQKNQTLSQNANDQVPATSFAYMSSEFLGQGD
jgi:chemotaxis protein methyltransferase CheR